VAAEAPSAPVATDPAPASAPAPAPAVEPAAPVVADAPAQAEDAAPATLAGPRDGQADNLKEIKGVGPKLEQMLHQMGFYHFDQIAAWTEAEVTWVNENLAGFKGRATRDNWVAQAKILAAGGETEFSARVGKGDVY
jgi:NADH-quinone oxidoreductase subunit E